jgi:coiled-coil domain-containing protein 55
MNLKTVPNQKKYGLVSNKNKLKPAAIGKPKLSMFAADEGNDDDADGEDDEGRQSHVSGRQRFDPRRAEIERVNRELAEKSKKAEASVGGIYDEVDSSVYDYDGAYDSFKATATEESSSSSRLKQSQDAPKAKYISNLISLAKVREVEKERIYERKLLKERKAEDDLFGDKPQFLTSAYKKKLEQEQKWKYEDSIAEEVEKRTDVRGRGMQGFYANLMTKNVAMGGDASNALSAYTAGSDRQKRLTNDGDTGQQMNGQKEDTGDISAGQEDAAPIAKAQARDSDTEDASESMLGKRKAGDSMHADVDDARSTQKPPISAAIDSSEQAPAAKEKPDVQTAILSAKERYLARKKAATSS